MAETTAAHRVSEKGRVRGRRWRQRRRAATCAAAAASRHRGTPARALAAERAICVDEQCAMVEARFVS